MSEKNEIREKIATRDAYGAALAELGEKNDKVVVFDADLSGTTRTKMFRDKFPQRHFNAGIAELNMANMAAGMAACGKIPYISTFAVFGAGRIYDSVRSAICYPKLPVKLAMTHAGLTVGEDGATHQMLEDIALMNALPNMNVLVPADAVEARACVFAAAEINAPVYMRFGREKTPVLFDESYRFELGRANVLRDGSDVALFACGVMVEKALSAAERLCAEGISAAVINMASIKPLDTETVVKYAEICGCAVTCEEHSIYGGLNSVIAQTLAQHKPIPLEAVAVMDSFGQSGKAADLLVKYGLTADAIYAKAKAAAARK